MTRSRSTRGYSVEFLNLVEALEKDPTLRITVPFETVQEARDFRLDFYTFRSAGLREGLDKTFPGIVAMFLEIEGTNAVVSHKDHNKLAVKLREAIQQAQEGKKG